jgi:hypothetical protein
MAKEYVEKRDSGYWIVGERVALTQCLCLFNRPLT